MAIGITIRTTKREIPQTWQPILKKLAPQKLWWHSRAYLTIFFFMGLTLGSLIIVHIYWLSHKLSLMFTQNKS